MQTGQNSKNNNRHYPDNYGLLLCRNKEGYMKYGLPLYMYVNIRLQYDYLRYGHDKASCLINIQGMSKKGNVSKC